MAFDPMGHCRLAIRVRDCSKPPLVTLVYSWRALRLNSGVALEARNLALITGLDQTLVSIRNDGEDDRLNRM